MNEGRQIIADDSKHALGSGTERHPARDEVNGAGLAIEQINRHSGR